MKCIEHARLAEYTTFRLGGPCQTMFDCSTADDVCAAVAELTRRGASYTLIGGGSNLLVADAGLDSAVIRFSSSSPELRLESDALIVGAGTSLDDLARFSVEQGIDGLVCCSGIPGTVGGAIVGNAGAFGEQVADQLISVTLLERHGSVREAAAASLGFAYRTSMLARGGSVVLSARFRCTRGDSGALKARRDEILALRASKHPDWRTTPTAGSFFKNVAPTSKAGRRQAAGWFLEQAGAMSLRVGGAHTFEKHANIVVADPGSTAQDVRLLTDQMAALVRAKFDLVLEREVKFLGAFG